MNGKFKALTLAIVAMFCFTAAIYVIDDKDSSAADSVEHYLYFEVVSEDGLVTVSDWIKFTSTTDLDDFIEKANAAFVYYGYPELKYDNSGSMLKIKYNDGGTSSCFVGSEDGASWVKVSKTREQYQVAKYIGLAVNNGYISKEVYDKLDDDQKKNWSETTMSANYAYVKSALEAKTTDGDSHKFPDSMTCHYFIEITSSDGTVKSSKWVEFNTLKTPESLVANANETFKNEGLSKLEFSIGSFGITVLYDGGMNNVSYYADSDKWVKVTDTEKQYLSESAAFSVGYSYVDKAVYDKFSDDVKSKYVEDPDMVAYGYHYYYKTVDESTTGYKSSDSNNTGLIVGIVVVVIVVIVAASFVFLKKK